MPKITDLTTGTVSDDDEILIVDGGSTRKSTVGALKTAIGAGVSSVDGDTGAVDLSGSYAPLSGSTNYAAQSRLYLPGSSGNYVSCPDGASLDITGDIDVRIKLAASDFSPGGTKCLCAKSDNSTNKSWRFDIDASGTPIFRWSADGSTEISKTATATLGSAGAVDGSPIWVRATLDVDNGASGNDVKFYTSSDGSTWTQLGSTVTTAGTTSIFSGSAVVEVGSLAAGTLIQLAGYYYKFQLLSGIGGTEVASLDLTTPAGSRQRDSHGNTWTINGSAWAWSF